jgi:hypothetical protein
MVPLEENIPQDLLPNLQRKIPIISHLIDPDKKPEEIIKE